MAWCCCIVLNRLMFFFFFQFNNISFVMALYIHQGLTLVDRPAFIAHCMRTLDKRFIFVGPINICIMSYSTRLIVATMLTANTCLLQL